MWRPDADIEPYNQDLLELEQALLAVYRRETAVSEIAASALLDRVFSRIDANPYQAVAMSRLKSSHAMTPRHGVNAMLIARAWAVSSHRLGDRLRDFSVAALLHDLGHWRPPELIYVFGPFTHDQMHLMQRHAELDSAEWPGLSAESLEWVQKHHEQPDGKGYPGAIRDPPMLAQALRIVDCFDGLTTPRSFRLLRSYPEALTLMSRWAGYKYDAGLFKSYAGFMGRYPVGSFLRLKSGEAGVALPGSWNRVDCLLLMNKDGDPLASPSIESLAMDQLSGEAPRWMETALPSEWENIRPDLLGLPRHVADPQ